MSIKEEEEEESSVEVISEEDEGQLQTSDLDDLEEALDRSTDPESLDYGSWLQNVGGLIRSENHVMMNSDEELRAAITQAMFLEVASENLIRKRKRQIDILDECRGEEGDVARQLFDDVRPVLKLKLGPRYEEVEHQLEASIAKSREPLTGAPDTRRPPPLSSSQMMRTSSTSSRVLLPPMHIPPPSMLAEHEPPRPIGFQIPALMSSPVSAPRTVRPRLQHLVPPPVPSRNNANVPVDFSRLDELEQLKKSTAGTVKTETEPEHEKSTNEHEAPVTCSSSSPHVSAAAVAYSSVCSARGEEELSALLRSTRGCSAQSTSWRQPHHLLRLPSLTTTPSVAVATATAFRTLFNNPIDTALVNNTEWSSSSSSPPPPPPPPPSSSTRGVVGVNVRGVFMGNKPLFLTPPPPMPPLPMTSSSSSLTLSSGFRRRRGAAGYRSNK